MKSPKYEQCDELIDRTRVVWRSRIGRDISPDEAQQIAANMTGFFSVLSEWSRQHPLNEAGETPPNLKGADDER